MRKNTIWKHLRLKLLSVFLLLGLCTALLGTAYGRYQYTTTKQIPFVVRSAADFKILSGAFTTEENLKRYTFQVENNENKQDTYFNLRLAVSLGVQLDGAKISLIIKNVNDTEKVYEGRSVSIVEDSALYKEMGPGCEYYFYDTDGNELSWKLEGGETSSQEFIIEVSNVVSYSMMDIIIHETQQTE